MTTIAVISQATVTLQSILGVLPKSRWSPLKLRLQRCWLLSCHWCSSIMCRLECCWKSPNWDLKTESGNYGEDLVTLSDRLGEVWLKLPAVRLIVRRGDLVSQLIHVCLDRRAEERNLYLVARITSRTNTPTWCFLPLQIMMVFPGFRRRVHHRCISSAPYQPFWLQGLLPSKIP